MANEFGERMMLPGTQYMRFASPHAFALEFVGYLRSQGVSDFDEAQAVEKLRELGYIINEPNPHAPDGEALEDWENLGKNTPLFHDPNPTNIMPQVKIEQEILDRLQRIKSHLGITAAHSQELITLDLLRNIWAITDNDTIPKPNRLKAMNIILDEFAKKYPGFTPTFDAKKQIAKITQQLES